MLSIFIELFLSPRERIKQAQLRIRREQRLVIVRPMEIDKVVSEILQDREDGGRTIDELAIGSGRGESALQDEIALARLDTGFDKLWI